MAEDSDPTAALLRAVAALDQDGGMSDVELEECRAALKAGRPILVDPLAFPGRKPEDRAAVQSRSVELTPGQALNLGGADVENALVLSDALDLNEKYCVELLVRAVQRGALPDDCARAAAGIHLRDRTSRAEALLRVLRQRSSPEAFAVDDEGNVAGHPALAREMDEYARDLLAGASASGGATLVGNLVEILRKPAPGSYPVPGVNPLSGNTAVPGSIPGAAGTTGGTAPSFIQTPGGGVTTPGGGAFTGFGATQPAANPLNPSMGAGLFGGVPSAAPGGIFGAQQQQQGMQPGQTPALGLVPAQQPGQLGALTNNVNRQRDPFHSLQKLEFVEDDRGRLVRRAEWLANERRVVAECLYHAVVATGTKTDADGAGDTPGGALTAADAKNIIEVFAEVAAPTVARACADARARALDATRAQAAAAAIASIGGLDEYSGNIPGSTPPPVRDLPRDVCEDLPAASAMAFAAVAAVTPTTPGADGAKAHARVIEAATAALQKAVDDANERAGGVAPVEIDPLRAFGDHPFQSQSQGQGPGGFGNFNGAQQPGPSSPYGPPLSVPGAPTSPYGQQAQGGVFGGGVQQQQQMGGGIFSANGNLNQPGNNQPNSSPYAGSNDNRLNAHMNTHMNGMTGSAHDGKSHQDDDEEERVAQMLVGVLEFVRLAAALTGLDLGKKEADTAASVAADAGALTAARAMLCTGAFQDDADASRRSYLELTHLVVRRALGQMLKNPAVGEALAAVVPAPTQQQQERETAANEHWESNTLFETDAELQRQREEEEERLRLQREEEDAVREAPLTALCGLLSEVYGQAPDLPAVASDVLPGFLDAVVEWEHSVESLVGVVGLMAAVASTGVNGAGQIWRRMQHPSAGVSVTWDSFISALVGYNRRFQFGGDTPQELEENERRAREAGGGVGYGHSVGAVNPYAAAFSREREMPEADVQGLSAYLGLLSALLEAAPAAEASSWTQWLEGRYGFALLDNLVVLLGFPVPAKLKSSILDAIAAFGGGSPTAAADAWRRLEQSALDRGVVGSNPAGVDVGGGFSPYGLQNSLSGSPYGGNGLVNGAGGYGAAAAARQQHSYHQQQLRDAARAATLSNQLCVPGSDANYEFMRGEARSRTYPHAHSYVKTVNALLAATVATGSGPSAGAGRASVTAFRFVRDSVFGNLARRQHRSATERWSLARSAVEHFRLQLELFNRAPDETRYTRGWNGVDPGSSDPGLNDVFHPGIEPRSPLFADRAVTDSASLDAYAPGRDLMVDFLSDGVTFRGVLAVLSVGHEFLTAERTQAHGEALEGCVLACLECVVTALAMDKRCADAMREFAVDQSGGSAFEPDASLGAFHSTIDQVIMRDASQCAAVLGYVSYRFNPALPLAAVRILSELSGRVERLVDLLPRASRRGLVEGCASVLELAVLSPPSDDPEDAAADEQISSAGAAVLDVLLDCLGADSTSPSMTHLLLGFDVGGEVANSRLDPFGEFNCLTVLLELMESTPPSVAAGKQSLGLGANQERGAGHCEAPETAARLVFELAANDRTRGPAIELLQNWPPGAPAPAQRLPLLLSDALAASPPAEIEPGSAGSRRAASAHYRSWIMRAAALVLDATAPPFGSFPAASVDDLPPIAGELTRNILSLGLDGDGEGVTSNANASDVERPRMAALELLATLPPPPAPPLAAARECARRARLSPDASALQSELRVHETLSDRRPFDSGGVLEVTARGDAVVGVRALGARLLEASRRVSTSNNRIGGGFGSGLNPGMSPGSHGEESSKAAHKEAIQVAVRMARAFNASVEEHAAHVHAVSAWSELVAVCASRCLPGSVDGVAIKSFEDPQEVLFRLGDGVLAHLASDTLDQAARVDADGGDGGGGAGWWDARCPPLARLSATLMRRLRASARGGGFGSSGTVTENGRSTADADAIGGGPPGSGISTVEARFGSLGNLESPPLPATRCKALLRAILSALLRPGGNRGAYGYSGGGSSYSGGDPEVRAALYAALLSFLQYVRPARLAQLPGSVLSAARTGGGDSSKVDAALVQAAEQNELEASTSSLIRRDAGPLVELIARDVTVDGVDDELKATALATVEALVAATVVASGGSSEVSSHRNGGHAGGAPGTPLGMHGVGNAFGSNLNAFGSPAAVGSAFQRGAAASASRLKPNGTSFNPGLSTDAPGPGTPYGQSDSAQTHLDPAVGALGQSLARSGIVRACLAAVERAALPDLILPTAAAAAKLASVRAALSLLLRLAQLPGGGARALASSGAMAALTNCRAIDAYTSDGPGDAAAVAAQAAVRSSNFNDAGDEYDSMGGLTFDGGSTYGGRDENANPNAEYEGNGRGAYGGQGGSREGSGLANSPIAPLPLPRARHHALLVPVLRLAGTLVNALCAADDGGEMHASGIAFLEAHKSVISRILSDRTRHAHLSDLAELEAAVTLVARLVAHRRGDVNDVVNQPAGSNTGTPGVPGIQAPGLGTPAQSPSALSAHRWRIVDECVPALDALTAKLITGDGKYDAYIAAGSPDGSPSASTSHAEIARRLAHERAKGFAAFGGTNANNSGGFPELGGLEPPAAAAAAARMERSLRAVRAALVSTQLALAEQGRATFRATDPNRHLEMDAAANPKPALSNFAGLVARVSEELGCEVRTRVRLLRRLAADGGAAAAAAVAADAFGGFSGGAELAAAAAAAANLNGGSFPFSGAAEASAAAAAVAARERAVRVLSHTCEASLELILGRLWSRATGTGIQSHGYSVGSSFPNVPAAHSPYGGVGSAFVRDGSAPAQGYTAPNASYSSSEIAELSAILTPAISALSELTDLGGNPEDGKDTAGGLGQLSGLGDGSRLRGLIRRTRDTLLAAVPAGVAEPPTLLLAGDRSSIGNEFGVGGNSFGVNSPAGNYPAQSPLPPPRFGLFNA